MGKLERHMLKKEDGGLGVKDLQVFNKSLLGKWRWNIFHHKHGLWSELLKAKYNDHCGILDNNEHPWESTWWKNIKKTCRGLSDNKWFDEGVTWKVVNGEKSRFWKDPWLDGQTLENYFPRVFLV